MKTAAFSPDGQRVLTASVPDGKPRDNTVRVWDVTTKRQLAVLHRSEQGESNKTDSEKSGKMGGPPAAFSPDGQRVVTAWHDDGQLWDAYTGQQLATLRGYGRKSGLGGWESWWISCAAFSPDGQRVLIAWGDEVRLWDSATGLQLGILRGHGKGANSGVDFITGLMGVGIISMTFSPNGERVLTTSSDKTARLWDIGTEQELIVLRRHKETVTSAMFSPDGQHVITGSEDKTARLWDVATGEERAVLPHEFGITSVTFSTDGQHILTASRDGTIWLWRVFSSTQKLIDYAHSIVPRHLTMEQRRQFFLQ